MSKHQKGLFRQVQVHNSLTDGEVADLSNRLGDDDRIVLLGWLIIVFFVDLNHGIGCRGEPRIGMTVAMVMVLQATLIAADTFFQTLQSGVRAGEGVVCLAL